MAGKQGRMQSLPFKISLYEERRMACWPIDRDILTIKNGQKWQWHTHNELLVSRPSRKREPILLADIRIGRRIHILGWIFISNKG